MAKFIVRALFAALGLWLAAQLVPGIEVADTLTLAVAAVLLGVVNAFVRPVVFVLTRDGLRWRLSDIRLPPPADAPGG